MKLVRDSLIIARVYGSWALADPCFYLLMSLGLPLGTAVTLCLLVPEPLRVNVIVGSMVMSVMVSGLVGLSQDLAADRYTHRMGLFVTMPVSPMSYAIGLSLASGVSSLLSIAVLLCVGQALGLPVVPMIPMMLPVLAVAWLMSLSFGFMVGTLANPHIIGSLSNLLLTLLVFFGPVYYDPSILPRPLFWLAHAVPSMYAARAIRRAFSGEIAGSMVDMALLLAFALVFSALALTRARWRER